MGTAFPFALELHQRANLTVEISINGVHLADQHLPLAAGGRERGVALDGRNFDVLGLIELEPFARGVVLLGRQSLKVARIRVIAGGGTRTERVSARSDTIIAEDCKIK